MSEELTYKNEAAAEYDRAFAHVTRYFMPFVLRAARIARGMRVLDIAAGTGLSAEAALSAVGPTGHVTAADVSPAMAEKARERLSEAPNASVLVEDAQALSFSDETFDAVVCNLGLMLFPEPARGLSEFRRVLRPGGWAAVSVNTVPERSYNSQINVILTRYVPGLAEAVTRIFSLGEASRLEELFRECGFSQIETRTVKHTFVLPSFDAYYGPFERGGVSTGQALAASSSCARRSAARPRRHGRANRGRSGIQACKRQAVRRDPMSALGLGRAKTSAVAPHIEISPSNCISGSQITLHTRGSMPCWRIMFSTFRGCMSFYTARVKTGKSRSEQMLSGLPPKPDSDLRLMRYTP
jgi:ubiquinone/menaquinone biosynthesis C-methylase UbiE